MKRRWLLLLTLLLTTVFAACSDDYAAPVCGNGVVEAGEQCDGDDPRFCTPDCRIPFCGDGIVQGSEECDNGAFDGPECTRTCQKPRCGDGIVQAPEECDDGSLDDTGPCTKSCKLAVCGDGVVQIGVEACDEGEANGSGSCTAACKLSSCGNGVVDKGEACDDGNHDNRDGCTELCLFPFCGDGFVWEGHEECDDGGGNDDHGACLTTCVLPRCGDGLVQGLEECDDGNSVDTDSCTTICELARCGDGYVYLGFEECDDANGIDTDGCLNACTLATCGDGVVRAGFEQCDDGPKNCDGCACQSDCANAACGNCQLDPGEKCDDCDLDNTDGCLMSCQDLDMCKDFEITKLSPAGACGLDPNPPTQIELTASGVGFLIVNGKKPTVMFDGAPATLLSMSNAGAPCTPIFGGFNSLSSCTTLVAELPPNLGVGDYELEVINPTTQKCAKRTAIYSVAGPPVVTAVEPSQVCQDAALAFIVKGTGFTNATTVAFTGPKAPKTPLPNDPKVVFINSTTLSVSFIKLNPGLYDVTVDNGASCTSTKLDAVEVLPNPFIFFVDPPVVYNGINTRATAYVANINGGKVNGVSIRPSGSNGNTESIGYVFDPDKPSQVQVDIPMNSTAGYGSPRQVGLWDMFLDDGHNCPGMLEKAFRVTNSVTVALESVDAPFAYTASRTDIRLFATVPPPAGKVAFQNVPSVYLNPVGNPNAFATKLRATNFLSDGEITATVPEGLTAGSYDVIVINPDGSVGLLAGGFTVTANEPPAVTDLAPAALPTNSDAGNIVILGKNFGATSTVSMTCKATDGTITTPPLGAVTFNSSTKLTANVPAKTQQIQPYTVCVVRVTNADKSYAEFSALGFTNASGNIAGFEQELTLNQVRRAPAAASGQVTDVLHHVWALGGDTGTVATGATSIETLALDKFGEGVDPTGTGKWRTLPVALPGKRTFAAARTIRRFVYLVGGNSGVNANDSLATAHRARILDPTGIEVTDIEQLAMVPDASLGLEPGLWYYRVSAVLESTDPYNPNGEELPCDALPVIVPASVGMPIQVRIDWLDLTAAPRNVKVKEYRVYRSPVADLVAGQEKLLATVPGTQSYFNDTGGTTTNEVPRRQGDLGTWVPLASMATQRQGHGLSVVQNPENPLAGLGFAETWHLYALGGKDQTGAVKKSYEMMTIGVRADGTQSTNEAGTMTWTTGANSFGVAGWQLGALTLDNKISTNVPAGVAFVYVTGGVDAAGLVAKSVDAAQVNFGGATPGLLNTWSLNVGQISTTAAGHGSAIVDQVFTIGAIGGTPNSKVKSGFICPASGCASTPAPQLGSINDNGGGTLNLARYLMGSTTEVAHFFIIGGNIVANDTTAAGQTATTESSIW